jgi:hypothetical protein
MTTQLYQTYLQVDLGTFGGSIFPAFLHKLVTNKTLLFIGFFGYALLSTLIYGARNLRSIGLIIKKLVRKKDECTYC